MVALVLLDALMQHQAQCGLFDLGASFNSDSLPLNINRFGKKLEGYGIGIQSDSELIN
jgi:hypothetical protein